LELKERELAIKEQTSKTYTEIGETTKTKNLRDELTHLKPKRKALQDLLKQNDDYLKYFGYDRNQIQTELETVEKRILEIQSSTVGRYLQSKAFYPKSPFCNLFFMFR